VGQIVAACGGTVSIENAAGGGARVLVILSEAKHPVDPAKDPSLRSG
jgi:hypothetical protein